MCSICRIVGRNVFEDQPDVEHDPLVDDAATPDELPVWYVWRRSDSCVATTNMHPDEIFGDAYTYQVLVVTTNVEHATFVARCAILCN